MKRLVYAIIPMVLATMIWTTGCTERKTDVQDTISDSIAPDTLAPDTLETLIEETPMPKAADELFDDFFFNFAANRKLQMERTDFPLLIDDHGVSSTIEKREWRMEHFFMRQGFYTLVAESLKDIRRSKDTHINHVVVEKVLLEKQSVRQYIFNRIDGLWKLQEIKTVSMANNENGKFYTFYNKFVTDSLFRQEALAENVEYSGPDPDDDFSRLDGSIMPEQWSMFAPEIPVGTIYNIIYGDHKMAGSQRVLVLRGIANGFEIEMTFQKAAHGYILTKLNT